MELLKRLNGTRGLKRKRVKTIAVRRKHFWKAIRGFPVGAEVEVCASDDRDFRRGERLVIQEFSARSIILRKQDGDRWNFGPAALESLQLRPLGSPFAVRLRALNGEVKQ